MTMTHFLQKFLSCNKLCATIEVFRNHKLSLVLPSSSFISIARRYIIKQRKWAHFERVRSHFTPAPLMCCQIHFPSLANKQMSAISCVFIQFCLCVFVHYVNAFPQTICAFLSSFLIDALRFFRNAATVYCSIYYAYCRAGLTYVGRVCTVLVGPPTVKNH